MTETVEKIGSETFGHITVEQLRDNGLGLDIVKCTNKKTHKEHTSYFKNRSKSDTRFSTVCEVVKVLAEDDEKKDKKKDDDIVITVPDID